MLVNNPPVALTGQLWMLGTAAYPLYLFHAPGGAAIVEGGTGAMAGLLGQQIESLGIARAAVTQLVITHAHPDHVMAVPRLREVFPSLSVVASQPAAKTLAAEKAIAAFAQVDEALTASLLAAGAIREEHRPQPMAPKPIAVDRVVREGDTIAVGDIALEVLETPGHSECSLSLYEPRSKTLLISDATGYFLPEHHTWWPNYFAGYGAYLRSIERLASLEAEILCLSHNAAVCGSEEVRGYFADALAATRAYHDRIVAEARAGSSVRQIAEQLGAEIYRHTQLMPLDFFQKNCGFLVKQSLRHEGIEAAK